MTLRVGSIAPSAGVISSSIFGDQVLLAKEFLANANYTSLIAVNHLVDSLEELVIKWDAYRGFLDTVLQSDNHVMRVSRVTFDYMSNIDADVRERRSLAFCAIKTSSKREPAFESGGQLVMKRC